MTNSVWGAERVAVREYMKEEWKIRFIEEVVKNDLRRITLEQAAEEEAFQILEVDQ